MYHPHIDDNPLPYIVFGGGKYSRNIPPQKPAPAPSLQNGKVIATVGNQQDQNLSICTELAR